MTFVAENVARAAAQSYRVAPVSVYELRSLMESQGKLLTAGDDYADDDADQPDWDDAPF